MKKETIKRLKRKGWSEEDIRKTQKIIEERMLHDKSRSLIFSNKVVFWAVIFVIILGNFIISMLFIPFLLLLNKIALDITIIVIGLAFGALFNLVVVDIRYIEKKHHLIAGLTIPVLAFINLSFMVKATNALNEVLRLSTARENPITISIIYVIAFMIPFLWSVFVSRKIDIAYKRKGIYKEKETQKEFLKKY